MGIGGMKKYIPDILMTAGAISMSAGAYVWHPAIGLIIAGALMLIAGIKLAALV